MKKFLPLILLLVGILVLVGAYFLVIRKDKTPKVEELEEEVALIEVNLPDRPVAKLTPRADGHWLDVEISKIGKFEAFSMDYELLYKLPGEGGNQGTSGTIKLDGQEKIEREALIGTESSGNYYYYNGVEAGTLTLRFRNNKGKLLAKFVSEFLLTSGQDKYTSFDGKFAFTPEKTSKDYFVVMDTIGYEGELSSDPKSPIYGIFTSAKKEILGEASIDTDGVLYTLQDTSWIVAEDSVSTGSFVKLLQ